MIPTRSSFALLFAILFLVSCNTSFTTSKAPVFSIPEGSLYKQLLTDMPCEGIQLGGQVQNVNGKKTTALVLQVQNAKHLPQETEQVTVLAKQLATRLKHALKDTSAYQQYQVIFISEETTGPVTQERSSETTFTANEL